MDQINESENNEEQMDESFDFINDINSLVEVPEETRAKWKEEHNHLFRLSFLGTTYVYRSFTYQEYKELRRSIREKYGQDVESGDEAFKESIQDICVLWPADYKERRDTGKPEPVPGGIPYLIGDYILAASGFADSIVPDILTNTQNGTK